MGRALHTIGDPQLVEDVAAEVAVELAAVEGAELGDLSGRSQQAVLLSREDASPVQVAAADQLLQHDPFGPDDLFRGIDPTAASVAAAHWLAAAAEVTGEASGLDPTSVVLEADNIEELPHESPTLVLGLINDGVSPYDAVTSLVRHAMQVTDGVLPDPTALREQLEDLHETLARHSGEEEPGLTDVALRLTPLDPQRPACDLLEDLLTGIHGCWLLHSEYENLDHDDSDDVEEWDDARAEMEQNRSRERFAELVRDTATRHRGRLI
ncbi:hypothetical protein [Streptomyces canus]|uniref:hypothetical protein n=1 Tax=Streptomyces canus TaxID=58343 RepID=UPI00371D9971